MAKKMQGKARAQEDSPQLEEIFQKVSIAVSPSAAESAKEQAFALQVASKLDAALSKFKAKVFFVGSTARDTGLKGDRDIDLFACFPDSYSREQIVEHTINATKSSIAGQWQMNYAEHPYLHAALGDYVVEVIPCFQAKAHEPIKSAVDRSPLHMDYLQKRLSPKQKRDVRVLKAMLKHAGVYGAESRVEGFSGLLCEYLVLNYRSLSGLLEAAVAWRPPVVIDIEGIRSAEAGGASQVASAYSAPLVLIDAIDKNRNAAAAVGSHALSTFISVSRSFLNSPSTNYFLPVHPEKRSPMPAKELRGSLESRGTAFFALTFPVPKDMVEDVLHPQLRKTFRSLAQRLGEEEFTVIDWTYWAQDAKAGLIIELSHSRRPRLRKVLGPPCWLGKECDNFVASHPPGSVLRGPFIKGERVCVELARSEVEASRVIADLLNKGRKVSVSPGIQAGIRRATLVDGSEIASKLELQNDSAGLLALEEYLFRKAYWL